MRGLCVSVLVVEAMTYTLILILATALAPSRQVVEQTYYTQDACQKRAEFYRWNQEVNNGEYVTGAICLETRGNMESGKKPMVRL